MPAIIISMTKMLTMDFRYVNRSTSPQDRRPTRIIPHTLQWFSSKRKSKPPQPPLGNTTKWTNHPHKSQQRQCPSQTPNKRQRKNSMTGYQQSITPQWTTTYTTKFPTAQIRHNNPGKSHLVHPNVAQSTAPCNKIKIHTILLDGTHRHLL